jgi:soluble lytic murein transglycosylase-like protein
VVSAVSIESKVSWLRAAALAAFFTCGVASPADAQIYTWRDADGRLVLSNVRPDTNPGIPSYEVPESDDIKTTRYAEAATSRSFDDLIAEHASRQGVRKDLVRAVIQVESAFNPRALSNKGAMGLMQLMPATARDLGVANPFDPSENVRGGVTYLRQLLDRYDGDERLALAAYNAGPGAVDRHGQTVPPFRETRDYVKRVNGLAASTAEHAPRPRIYRVVEVIDGREVVKYTDHPPAP